MSKGAGSECCESRIPRGLIAVSGFKVHASARNYSKIGKKAKQVFRVFLFQFKACFLAIVMPLYAFPACMLARVDGD